MGFSIGSLTSQHFANFYLGWLDRFVKETLRVRGYIRYMDDVVLWHSSRQSLIEIQDQASLAASCADPRTSGAAWTHERVELAAASGRLDVFFAGSWREELAFLKFRVTTIGGERSRRPFFYLSLCLLRLGELVHIPNIVCLRRWIQPNRNSWRFDRPQNPINERS